MKNLLTAIAKAKQEFKPIERSGFNPHYKSKYATLDDILNAIDRSLAERDLVLMQPTLVRDGQTIVKTVIYHTGSGEEISSELLLPSNLEPQKMGSAISYYRRYGLCSLLAIVADEDDDGNGTMSKPKITPVQKLPTEGERKAKAIFETMKAVGLKKDDVIQLAIEEYQTTDIRSLAWHQIEHMQKRMAE
jgi:hypothetical protein